MANLTNESFLEMIEKEHPDVDWDNLPPLDSKPTHWEIRGTMERRLHFLKKEKEIDTPCGFSCGPFATKEEAEAKIESMKTDPNWCEEKLFDDKSNGPMPSMEYHGPVKFETIHLVELEDDELTMLHFYKGCLDDIKAGKKVFPMYLP